MKKKEYSTRILTPETHDTVSERTVKSSWKKTGVVLKTMYHRFGLPGRIGDTVEVDPDIYDQLVAEKFIK